MASRRFRERAEKRTAADLDLFVNEVRGYMLSASFPFKTRQQVKNEIDWANADLIARRAVKKVQKKYDIEAKEAKEVIRDCYRHNYNMAEEEVEDEGL